MDRRPIDIAKFNKFIQRKSAAANTEDIDNWQSERVLPEELRGFNWGALIGWAAVLGRLDWAPIILYCGAVAWTIGYDTIYAHQDREDDALIGMKSTALRFGRSTPIWLSAFYGFAFSAIVFAGWLSGAGGPFFLVMALAGAHLVWQVATIDIDDPQNCLKRFRSNRDFGLLFFFAPVADMALAS